MRTGLRMPKILLKPSAKIPNPQLEAGVSDLGKLEASVNATSQRMVAQWIAYLSLWAYLFFATLSITDRDLLLLTPIKLPLIGVELGLRSFFWTGPPLFWVFHLYLARKIIVLTRDLNFYHAEIHRCIPWEKARKPHYHCLDAFFLTRFLGHPDQGKLLRVLDAAIAVTTLAVMPMVLMLTFQLRFLAFHDEFITNWHRICLIADLWLVVLFMRRAKGIFRERVHQRSKRAGWWQRGFARAAQPAMGLVAVLHVSFSLLIATFPGESHDGLLSSTGLELNASWKTLTLRDINFTLDKKIDKASWTVNLSGRNLSGAQLIGVDLQKALMRNVDLRNSKIEYSNFQEADISNSNFSESKISSSNFKSSNINYSDFRKSHIKNSDFRGSLIDDSNFRESSIYLSEFKGAKFDHSEFQGSDINDAQFQGVSLQFCSFQGASLSESEFQGADLSYSKFQGANLSLSEFQGANFKRVQLQGAFMHRAKLWRAFLEGNDSGWTFKDRGAWLRDYNFVAEDYRFKQKLLSQNMILLIESITGEAPATSRDLKDTESQEAISFTLVEGRGSVVFDRGPGLTDEKIREWVDSVPPGARREAVAKSLAVLSEERPKEVDEAGVWQWRTAFGTEPPDLSEKLTEYLIDLSCRRDGRTVHGVVSRALLGLSDFELSFDARLVAGKLLESSCAGEKYLSHYERVGLRRLIQAPKATVGPQSISSAPDTPPGGDAAPAPPDDPPSPELPASDGG